MKIPQLLHRWLQTFAAAAALGIVFPAAHAALDYAALIASVDATRAARYEVFRDFRIRGFCAGPRLDLAASYGANTIRTYVPPTRAQLDEYQRLGFKVVVGIWMPHQGDNTGPNGKWSYDYAQRGAELEKGLRDTVARIGDHPAILLWCLGNEVHLDRIYLETVNRMSEYIHAKLPRALTSLTMVNGPKEKIALIKELAPDLDLLGYNSYGQSGLVAASRNMEEVWDRPYYVSEFGPRGPWSGRKTAWGTYYEQDYPTKLEDIRTSLARIESAPRCLGSTMFIWGYWRKGIEHPTYFSAFLYPDDVAAKKQDDAKLFLTPISDEFARFWSGKYPAQRAPILTRLAIDGVPADQDAFVAAGKKFTVTAAATDPDTPLAELRYRWWILGREGQVVAGPVDTVQPTVELTAPAAADQEFFVMAHVLEGTKRASGFTLPFKTR